MIKSAVLNIAVTFNYEFARMFAEDMYTYRFDENQMNTI